MGTTGNFDVAIANEPSKYVLLHSKKQQGLGKCETSAERERLFKLIRVYLDHTDKQ
jgi:hypothetical protein